MGSRLRVFLTSEQDKTLFNLRTADVPQKVRDRAEVIRLSAHGWYVDGCLSQEVTPLTRNYTI
ncbi:hypothetical protein [Nostoc sp. DedQUE12b]|uniref:hypothetical protein n=1 Tax=Nostoc sp. DedQUE12b TaxID=3075398 RepID=UPI003A0FEBCA